MKILIASQTLTRGSHGPLPRAPAPLPASFGPKAIAMRFFLARDEDLGAGQWQSTELGWAKAGASAVSYQAKCIFKNKLLSAFWPRSSVVSVLISLVSDAPSIWGQHVDWIFGAGKQNFLWIDKWAHGTTLKSCKENMMRKFSPSLPLSLRLCRGFPSRAVHIYSQTEGALGHCLLLLKY